MNVVVLDHPRFVNPARAEDVVNAPLSSCMFTGYVAAMLQASGFNLELVDANLQQWSCEQTVAHVAGADPDLLAVNLIYMWDETVLVLDMLREIKERRPQTHITLFGYYPTFGFEFLLKRYSAIDSVILGEPEATALQLAHGLRTHEEWTAIPGLAFRAGDAVVRNERRALIQDLDSLPFPIRTDAKIRAARGVSPYVLGSRGCYNECAFCYLNAFYGVGPQWRGRSPENILAELRRLQAQEPVSYFYFADANFFGPGRSGQERALRLAQLIKSETPGVQFGLECRANDVEIDTMTALRDAGLRDVFLGVESGCNRTLARLRKHLRAEENARAIEILRDLGIHTSFGYIMFDPYSTLEEVRESFEFLKNHGLLEEPCVTAHLLHHRARILQGTPMFQAVRSLPGADCESFGGYECNYTIADKRVDVLARCVEPEMRRILAKLSHRGEDPGGGGLSPHLNEETIRFFEVSLEFLEKMGWQETEKKVKESAQRPTAK